MTAVMEYQELLDKYYLLQRENKRLREENRQLKIQLGAPSPPMTGEELGSEPAHEESVKVCEASAIIPAPSPITLASSVAGKLALFMSLFRGRQDIYATRWENLKSGESGYAPVCLHRRKPGLCGKPRIPCAKCRHQNYAQLDEAIIKRHLLGEIVVGLYPLLQDETCWFLAMDFDDEGWRPGHRRGPDGL